MDLVGRLIIVTGASSGLGRAIARVLALQEGADVVLAARRWERLEELQAEITAAGRGRAWICEVDLSTPDGPGVLLERANEIARESAPSGTSGSAPSPGGVGPSSGGVNLPARPLFGLVNNAGVTYWGRADLMSAEDLERILAVNVRGTLELTRRFVQQCAGRTGQAPHAAVLTVTSLAAHLPVPYQAAYAASKHALQAFTESLWFELRSGTRAGGPRIVSTTVAPGGIDTEMIERSGLDTHFSGSVGGGSFVSSAEKVARQAVRAWKREHRSRVAGFGNRVVVWVSRFLPRALLGWMSERLYRP